MPTCADCGKSSLDFGEGWAKVPEIVEKPLEFVEENAPIPVMTLCWKYYCAECAKRFRLTNERIGVS